MTQDSTDSDYSAAASQEMLAQEILSTARQCIEVAYSLGHAAGEAYAAGSAPTAGGGFEDGYRTAVGELTEDERYKIGFNDGRKQGRSEVDDALRAQANRLDRAERDVDAWRKEGERLRQRAKQAYDERDAARAEVAELNKTVAFYQSELEQRSKERNWFKDEHARLASELSRCRAERDQAQAKLDRTLADLEQTKEAKDELQRRLTDTDHGHMANQAVLDFLLAEHAGAKLSSGENNERHNLYWNSEATYPYGMSTFQVLVRRAHDYFTEKYENDGPNALWSQYLAALDASIEKSGDPK